MDIVSHSFGQTPRSTIDGECGKSMLNVVRNSQTVSQRGCAILHSHQPHMRVLVVPFVPHPGQHLAVAVIQILAIPGRL